MDSVQEMMEGGEVAGAGVSSAGRGRAQSTGKAGDGGNKGKGKAKETGTAAVVDDYNARAVRHSLRVFIATGALMKLWGLVSVKLLGRKKE